MLRCLQPDVVAYGKDVSGSKIQSGCRSLSGTSVASPVVAGAVCLLASVLPKEQRWRLLNPASMKQALVEGATRIDGPHMYEQGQGKINLVNSMVWTPSILPWEALAIRCLASCLLFFCASSSVYFYVSHTYSWPYRGPKTIAQGILKNYKPRASAVPGSIDLTNCPYMWPHCKQPLYASALPVRA